MMNNQDMMSQSAMGSGSPGPDTNGGQMNMQHVNPASMSPLAMNNFMGNPMNNGGANMMGYLGQQQMFTPQPPEATYAQGGYVKMAMGGNPAEAMMQQGGGAPPDPSQGMGGISSKGPLAESIKESDPEEAPLADVANALDLGDDTQLTFINEEELQALTQMGGEPPQMAQDVAPDPALVEQLMQGVEGEDYILVYLTQDQFNALIEQFGEPTVNKASGVPQFGFFKSVAKAVKSVVKSPIFQAVAPLALNAFAPGIGSALGGALGLGSMGTSALISGGLGMLGGGGIKGGLKGAALGALGQGVGDYLSSGTNPFSGMMGGGTEAGTGFGLNSGAASTPGINANPTGGVGLNPSAGLTPTANSIAGAASSAPRSGLASLMPESTMGKALLGLTAAQALGVGGKRQEDGGAPPPPPGGTFTERLPQWNLNRNARSANYNPFAAQSAEDRTYFNDQFTPIAPETTPATPRAAKRGGYMGYAQGGLSQMQGQNMMPPPHGGEMGGMPMGAGMPPMGRGMGSEPPLGLGGSKLGPPPPPPPGQEQGGQPPGGGGAPPAMGGAPQGPASPLSQQMVANLFNKGMKRGGLSQVYIPQEEYDSQMRGGFAMGGMTGYDGGGLLQDGSDGVADDIPASIGGKQPAKLSGGEFVIPARVVSELGNGNTEAGAKQLYAFMDKVQSGMRKNKDIAKDTKSRKHLPA